MQKISCQCPFNLAKACPYRAKKRQEKSSVKVPLRFYLRIFITENNPSSSVIYSRKNFATFKFIVVFQLLHLHCMECKHILRSPVEAKGLTYLYRTHLCLLHTGGWTIIKLITSCARQHIAALLQCGALQYKTELTVLTTKLSILTSTSLHLSVEHCCTEKIFLYTRTVRTIVWTAVQDKSACTHPYAVPRYEALL
jgi:hypothetical protein